MSRTTDTGYWARLGVAISILLAALFGAELYETLCAAAWRNRGYGWARVTIWLTNFIEPNHCKISARLHDRLMRRWYALEDKQTLHFLWRWVERSRGSVHTPAECVEVMWHHPGAPWNDGKWPNTGRK